MAEVLLIGRVLPERRNFSLNGQRLRISMPNRGVDAWLLFGVIDNQLTAKFIGELGDLSNTMLRSITSQAVGDVLNSVAFVNGHLSDLDLTGLLRDNDSRADGSFEFHYFDPNDEVVAARKTTLTVQEILSLFGTNAEIPMRQCLNDLHMALKHHADSPFYCYRALEIVKGHLGRKVGECDDKKQWEIMRKSLGVDRAKIEKVKKYADPLRHGRPVTFTGAEWRETIAIAWDVVESYVRHLRAELLLRPGSSSGA